MAARQPGQVLPDLISGLGLIGSSCTITASIIPPWAVHHIAWSLVLSELTSGAVSESTFINLLCVCSAMYNKKHNIAITIVMA